MQPHPIALETVATTSHHIADLLVKGVGKWDMQHKPVFEEGMWPDALGAIDGLIGDHEVAGLDLLREGACGGEGNDAAHADVAEGSDVGARRHLRRVELVMGAVAREEGDRDRVARRGRRVFEDGDRRRRRSPRCRDGEDCCKAEIREVVETCAAYHANVDGACATKRILGKQQETKNR